MRLRHILVHTFLVCTIVSSVCLASCNGSNGSTTIPESTQVLDETTLNHLSGASVNSSKLVFENTTDQLSSLSVGDVLVSGTSNVTPYGLLRKVTNVVFDENQVVVETSPATLEDVIEDCSIDTSWRLQSDGNFAPLGSNEAINALGESVEALATGFYLQLDDVVLYDNDGNLDTKGDKITADLSINLNIDIDIGWTISWFQMTEAHFQSTISVTSEVETSCTIAVLEIHPKLEVYRQYLAPFTVMVGPVPVVILPMLSINIGLDGEVSAGITAGVTANAELTAGVQYADGNWSPITDFSTSFNWQEPSLTAGCKVKVSAGPQLSLLLYGGAGPYIEARGYLELDADIFRTPWWELYGGLEADVGFKVEAMGHKVADYEKPLAIGYRVLLAQAETPTLVTLTISSTVGGSVTTPEEGSFTYDAGTVVDLVATPAAGYRFVNWTGDVSTITNVNAASTTITMNGDYSITANFEEIPPVQYDLTISSTAGGSVTTPGTGTYNYDAGTVVNLVATPAAGYRFVNWTGDVGTLANVNAASTTITMNGDYSITANFEGAPTETVSTPSRPSGPTSGTVGTAYTYTTGGSTSNLGHSVQYYFTFGDGTNSGWLPVGTTSVTKTWSVASADGWAVMARARCATHTSVVSGWSSPLVVSISAVLTFTSLTPSTITTSAAPYDATLSAIGTNFNNVNRVTFSWTGAASGSTVWDRGGSDWNSKVTVNSDTSMTLRPRVVETYPTWSGTVAWTVTLRDTTGATASRSFAVTYNPTVTLTLYVHENSASGPIIVGALVTGYDGSGKAFSGLTNSYGYVTITGTPGTWSFIASKSGYWANSWSQSITSTCTKHAYLIKY